MNITTAVNYKTFNVNMIVQCVPSKYRNRKFGGMETSNNILLNRFSDAGHKKLTVS